MSRQVRHNKDPSLLKGHRHRAEAKIMQLFTGSCEYVYMRVKNSVDISKLTASKSGLQLTTRPLPNASNFICGLQKL